MKNQPKQYEDDDGRVICNMDVEGMRGHGKRMKRELQVHRASIPGEQITRSEARRYTWYSMLAALLIVGVFSVTWILFTLFCTLIWFR
jgi:hypothetical protein